MTETAAAITRSDISDYVYVLFFVYIVVIFIRVLLSFVPRMPYNRTLAAVVQFVHDTTDPYLNLFRRVLPPIGGGNFALDLTPMIAIFALFIAQWLVVGLIRG